MRKNAKLIDTILQWNERSIEKYESDVFQDEWTRGYIEGFKHAQDNVRDVGKLMEEEDARNSE